MKRAWEWDHELIENAVPRVLSEEEQQWTDKFEFGDSEWEHQKLMWKISVPGSGAPEIVTAAAIASMDLMGYDVTEAEKLIPLGIKAREEENIPEVFRISARVRNIMNNAKKIEGHPYWNYAVYDTVDKYLNSVEFEKYEPLQLSKEEFYDKIHAGWVAQICAAALGTAIEGYSTDNLRKVFGEIRDYVRKPNTYNDDITFEIAFLEAFIKKGHEIESSDIAEEWFALVPSGWSAEEIALKNIKYGIYPPESGYLTNPFREWIGAQMRGAICGMAAPGDPREAARLAYIDGVVSHYNNGVLGEIFNAIITSISFVESDIKTICFKAMNMIPKDSEYYSVIKFAWDACEEFREWEKAWKVCEEKYKKYNWVHAYPNAAAEVVAMYFSNNDLDTCLHIIAMCGQDVDCNAGQIATPFGIIQGLQAIDKRWTAPIGDKLVTYMRKYEETTITHIAQMTCDAVISAGKYTFKL